MKVATPQSLPEGDRSSAGMIVSTAATMNACSASLSASRGSGSRLAPAATAGVAEDWLGAGVCAVAGEPATPAAAAVLANPTPTKKSRRGSVSPAMRTSLPGLLAAGSFGWEYVGRANAQQARIGNGPGYNAARVL